MNPDMYQNRGPIDLTNLRRRKLAAALGSAYVRVSGTWANTTYFCDANGPVPKSPPKGFNGVLTRQQWKGVIAFANAVNVNIPETLYSRRRHHISCDSERKQLCLTVRLE